MQILHVLTNPVIVSVVVLCALSLAKLNVLLAMIAACIAGGIAGNLPLFGSDSNSIMNLLCEGFSTNAPTALAYILLGTFAQAITTVGLADVITVKLSHIIGKSKYKLLLLLTICACMSQNIIPVHIAYIPILIPPLLPLMDALCIDRRAAACCSAFGLEMPYIAIPFGFGLIFQTVVATNITKSGLAVEVSDVTAVNWYLAAAMGLALLVSVFVLYRKPRSYSTRTDAQPQPCAAQPETHTDATNNSEQTASHATTLSYKHYVTIAAIGVVVLVQCISKDLSLSTICGFAVMIAGKAISWNNIDSQLQGGFKLMGLIAFVMLVAGGFAQVLGASGGVDQLVSLGVSIMGHNKWFAATVITVIGLFVTMGIGTSFGTVPILAVLFVPLCQSLGFSTPATILLISAAAALGDAGSPASDTTLGPTSGLNADGKHSHIWDTCVPTFLVFNIPLMAAGIVLAQFI